MQVSKRVRPRERLRLKRYVATENVTRTVPVRREEVRLEEEPAPDVPPEPPRA